MSSLTCPYCYHPCHLAGECGDPSGCKCNVSSGGVPMTDQTNTPLTKKIERISRCPACHGHGSVTKTYDDYGMADPKDVQCPVCEGSGFVKSADGKQP